jgi:PAS domain S-box-containing protein
MSGLGVFGLLASIFQLTVPSYALRLIRRYGPNRVGWFIVAAFASLALIHLTEPMKPTSAGSALVYILGSTLLVIGMGHLETVFSERVSAGRHEQRLRAKCEAELAEKTAELTSTNEQLRAELARREARERVLIESEAQFRTLFAENPQAMWIFDLRSFRFLAVNNAALRQYGFTNEEFMAQSVEDLFPPDTAPAFIQDAIKPCAGVESRGLWQHRRKDGVLIDVEVTGLDLMFGKAPARLVLSRDVSRRWQHELELRQVHKMEIIRQLSKGVAHHFNNILTVIEGHATLLLYKSKNPEMAESLQQISGASKRAAALTRQLNSVSGCSVIKPVALSANALIQKLAPTLRRLLNDGITFEIRLGSGIPLMLADPRVVESVLLSLVANARAAMSGRGTLTISTAGVRLDATFAEQHPQAKPGSFVCLTVRDTGCGMTPEVQSRLFEPFFTTHDVGGGAGLSLASAYGTVSQHSGWIEFASEEGVGTEFTVFLPAAPLSVTPIDTVGS